MIKTMKYLCALCLLCVVCVSCKDDETYADQKKKERKAVEAFLARDPLILKDSEGNVLLSTSRINVISEEQFEAQGEMTDTAKNEYVMFKKTGIYMQIVRQGVGEKLKSGDNKRIISRYWEYSLMGDSLQSTDKTYFWMTNPEIMDVSMNSGTITASFNIDDEIANGGGAMYMLYGNGSKSVPSGWIVPMSYIKVGRQTSEDGIALVRVLIPHSQGTQTATNTVTPYFYEISYQQMRD